MLSCSSSTATETGRNRSVFENPKNTVRNPLQAQYREWRITAAEKGIDLVVPLHSSFRSKSPSAGFGLRNGGQTAILDIVGAGVDVYGWSEVILGLVLVARYNIPDLPVLFVTTLITGFPAALGMAAPETFFQQKVPNSHLGRISGDLNTTVGLTSLFGVLGISGMLGDQLGIVPY